MQMMFNRILNYNWKIFVLLSLLLISSCATSQKENFSYISHKIKNNALIIESGFGNIQLTALESDAIEVQYLQTGVQQLPSFSKRENLSTLQANVENTSKFIKFDNGQLLAVIDKANLSIDFYRGEELLTRQSRYFLSNQKRGFDFKLDATEKILGGGQRVLGMDRRGHRMPLYNRAHYGYTTESNQMNFSLPLVMSNKKYTILFDNTAKGTLDIGKTDPNTLSFEAVSGRTAYIILSANTYPKLINNYVDVTGKQPLPPRWAFGHFLSRFGYRTEQEVRDVVKKTFDEDFPADTIILDLYWFGPDIQGHMGKFTWDEVAFPTHEKMITDLKKQGIKTILISEPFILSSSSKWQDAVKTGSLIKTADGEPYRFDFYFGNTGLVDVFDDKAQQWFGNIYADLFNQGAAGTWGDLGEPEVHPDDALHYLSDTQQTVRADAIHNAYGHQWAKLVFENQLKSQPNTRPFIMMRSGFAGSQRYGMIPWTGDVDRSWGGLKPQVELTLQMSLFGMAYMHSDLGGFAGAEVFDKEMYIRWLQYGVFQPIYRPHAQDHIAAEPVLHDKQTRDILREYVKLRYQMLPYNYTLAYENSSTGMPLMRPVFFEDETNHKLIDIKDAYLWGDSFFVAPVTEPNETSQSVKLPAGVWFNYWNDNRYQGGQNVEVPVSLQTIPVFVRAGSFIPMVDVVKTTEDYSSEHLTLHYYADDTVSNSRSYMYEDDGKSFDSIVSKAFEILNFSAKQTDGNLTLEFSREGQGYQGMPMQRSIDLIVHNWQLKPKTIKGQVINKPVNYSYNAKTKKLTISFSWAHDLERLVIK